MIVKIKQLLLLFWTFFCCPFFSLACSSESADEVPELPEEWITLPTTPLNFTFEGGDESRECVLGKGINVSQVEIKYSGDGADWLTASIQGGKLTIHCEHSYVERQRTSSVTLCLDDTHTRSLSVSQEAAPTSADRLIKVIGGEATSEETSSKDGDGKPLTLASSYDGDKKTYYNSKFGAVSYPFYLTYRLEEGHTLSRIVYTPRTDSGNKWGSLDVFKVEVTTADKPDEWREVGNYARGNGVHTPFNIKLATAVANVAKVRFVITKAYENRVSCAEMEFFEAGANQFDPTSVFADGLGTQLKPGLTEKQLKQIPNENLRALALALHAGEYDTKWRLADYRPYQHPSVMATTNKTNKYSLRDNPMGLFAHQGQTLPVFVGKIYQGGKISLMIQNVEEGYNNFRTYELTEGYNEVKVDIGGLMYILNHVDSDLPLLMEEANAQQKKEIADKTVSVHVAMGNVNGYFDIAKHQASDWINILKEAKYRDIDVLGHYAHVTWAADDFRKNATDIVKSIENCDRLVWLEQDFIGLVKHKKMFRNRMHFCIDYQAKSPNATDYRTVYNASTYYAEPFCVPDRFAARCWGPAHEVGHVNQTRPGIKWAGTTEVTNNILSLYVQTSFGQPCKLLVDGCKPKDENGNQIGEFKSIYEGARKLIVDGKRPHCLPGIGNIVRETQLVPFWQLKLYMVDVLGKEDFYRDLYEYYRTHPSPSDLGENQGMNQLDFVRQACAISGLNLLDFFIKWGFLYPVNTTLNDYGQKSFIITQGQIDQLKNEIKAKGYPLAAPNLHLITEDNLNNYK